MTSPLTIVLSGQNRRERAFQAVMQAPQGAVLKIETPKRSLPQNAKLHALITDVACQVEWAGSKRNVEAWKDIFTAALRSAKHGLDVVPGINGGFVLLGMHTSAMSKAEVAELIDLILAFGAERGVQFTDEAREEGSAEEAPALNQPGRQSAEDRAEAALWREHDRRQGQIEEAKADAPETEGGEVEGLIERLKALSGSDPGVMDASVLWDTLDRTIAFLRALRSTQPWRPDRNAVAKSLYTSLKTFEVEMRGQRYRALTDDERYLIIDFIDHAADDVADDAALPSKDTEG